MGVLAKRSTATVATVAASATSVTLFAAAGDDVVTRSVFNDSSANLFLKFGATASTSSFTVKIGPGGYYEFPAPVYTGIVDGIWDVANGNARTTEVG